MLLKSETRSSTVRVYLAKKTSKIRVFCYFLRARLYMIQFSRIDFDILLFFTIFYVKNSNFLNNFCELSGAACALKMKKVARTRASAFFAV